MKWKYLVKKDICAIVEYVRRIIISFSLTGQKHRGSIEKISRKQEKPEEEGGKTGMKWEKVLPHNSYSISLCSSLDYFIHIRIYISLL